MQFTLKFEWRYSKIFLNVFLKYSTMELVNSPNPIYFECIEITRLINILTSDE